MTVKFEPQIRVIKSRSKSIVEIAGVDEGVCGSGGRSAFRCGSDIQLTHGWPLIKKQILTGLRMEITRFVWLRSPPEGSLPIWHTLWCFIARDLQSKGDESPWP